MLLVKPSEQDLQEAQNSDPAFAAYESVCRAISGPNFLVLQHFAPAANFRLRIDGTRPLKLKAALRLISYLHSCTQSFGKFSTFSEQARSADALLGRSSNGLRIVCRDELILAQSEGDILPEGINRLLKPFEVTDKATFSKLTLAHDVRLVEEDGTKKIVEWRISHNPRVLNDRLR